MNTLDSRMICDEFGNKLDIHTFHHDRACYNTVGEHVWRRKEEVA